MLIIDDDESVRDYLRVLLEQAGYAVTALDEGRHAIDHLKRDPVDAIVLDLMMPSMDGWAVANALQADPVLRAIPIIVFTAADGAPPAGVAAKLVKPSTPEELLATIDRVIARERRRQRRYPARFDVRATTSGRRSITATTHDVSEGGLSFETTVAPRIGERINVILDLEVHGMAAMEVKVRHVAPARRGWRVGAQLVSFQYNAVGFDAELARLAQSSP